MSRGADAGIQMADAILEWLNLMYQRQTRERVLTALIKRLDEAAAEAGEEMSDEPGPGNR